MYTKEQHKLEHDSIYDPKSECEFCRYEVYRRTHKCFGDGGSTISIPVTKNNDK